eukprot:2708631-Amphidinium_carterae.2
MSHLGSTNMQRKWGSLCGAMCARSTTPKGPQCVCGMITSYLLKNESSMLGKTKSGDLVTAISGCEREAYAELPSASPQQCEHMAIPLQDVHNFYA